MKFITSILFAALITSCSTMQLYQGKKQSPENIVVIKGMSSLDISARGYASKVCSFDNKALESCQPFIEFLPGSHKLTVESSKYGITNNEVIIEKNFAAGERYLLGLNFKTQYNPYPALIYLGKYNKETKQVEDPSEHKP